MIACPKGYRRLSDDFNEWFSSQCYLQLSCGGNGEIYRIQDINGNDLPEWIISRGSCGYGRCGVVMKAFSYIDGEFVNILSYERPIVEYVSGGGGVRSSPDDGVWTFQNIDDDTAIEIIQTEEIEDNRGCVLSVTQIFDWDAQLRQYSQSIPQYEYADTAWCAFRQAYDAMKVI